MGFQAAPGAAVPSYVQVSYQAVIKQRRKDDVKIQTSSFTYFYNNQPTPTTIAYLPAAMNEVDLNVIKQTTYDPAFWQNNSAVKPTPLEAKVIKSFEQKGAFGTLLSP